MNYKVKMQYDGTRYEGWQKQGNTENTIQGRMEEVLSKMVRSDVEVQGAGRTDAGVHAIGQAANFHLPMQWVRKQEGDIGSFILEYMNHYLPEDICILEIEEAPERFHSRLNAVKKKYCYRLSMDSKPNVFERKYIYSLNTSLDLKKMKEAAQILVGTHDFKSFCSNKKMKKSTIRTIDSIDFERVGKELRVSFVGDGFLYHMVRILMGTLIEVGQNKRKAESVGDILTGRDRTLAGYTVPSKGLALVEVTY